MKDGLAGDQDRFFHDFCNRIGGKAGAKRRCDLERPLTLAEAFRNGSHFIIARRPACQGLPIELRSHRFILGIASPPCGVQATIRDGWPRSAR
jgi:hypothetical protein